MASSTTFARAIVMGIFRENELLKVFSPRTDITIALSILFPRSADLKWAIKPVTRRITAGVAFPRTSRSGFAKSALNNLATAGRVCDQMTTFASLIPTLTWLNCSRPVFGRV